MQKIINSSFLLTLLAATLIMGSCRKETKPAEASSNPQPNAIAPGAGASSTTLTLTGSGLGDVTSIVFTKGSISAPFNPVFNTESALVFRVPIEAVPGTQEILFTNSVGKEFKVAFNVLGLAAITDVSNYNFTTGTQLTLTGKNLDDVTKVTLTGTTNDATIVSKSATQLVISMPATAVTRATLNITNQGGTTTTTQEFVSLINNFNVFIDNYENGFSDGSWGPSSISTTVFKSGTASTAKTLPKGNWWVAGFASWNAPYIVNNPAYKFLTFWIKGGIGNQTLYFTGDQRTGGFGNGDQTTPLTIPANVWTYFKIPIGSLNLWAKGGDFKQFGLWVKGPDNADETFYFDDVMFVK
ncbi:MAG: IPT/TIG domain-containing protein [Chitinophagaceae bacterium]